jgi:sodium ion-translocating decarboxylase beta subunit
MLETLTTYLMDSGFGQFHWTNAVMILIGLLFIYLAIKKQFEPLLLVPIGFGMLIGNIPYDTNKLSVGVYDGPVSEHDIAYYAVEIDKVIIDGTRYSREEAWKKLSTTAEKDAQDASTKGGEWNNEKLMRLINHSDTILFSKVTRIDSHLRGYGLVEQGKAIMVNTHSVLSARSEVQPKSIVSYGQGRKLFVDEPNEESRYPEVWSLEKQDVYNASIFWWLFAGVGLAGFFPPLIFLGIGALTDFGPMLSNPRTLFLGAAAQFGIFGSLLGAIALGFTEHEAAAIGIIGGADGPTAIFTASQLAPHLLGAVALAAYSYMAMVPIIQPPIIRLLTTKKERTIRMGHTKPVSQRVKIMFPIIGFLLTAFLVPGGIPLLGMLFFGNLLRESLVTKRLAATAQTALIDIVTILLGVTVGAKTSAANFLTVGTIKIFILGILAFAVATAAGVLFGKLMNWLSRQPVNPMIGAAGVSAVPMSARVVHKLGLEEDPQNFLLMHAMGPNVAGVIGSAVAAGVLLSKLG